MDVLYLSYDGMTDPLGQSQVMPYLMGLSKKGLRFHLISFEKPERMRTRGEEIAQIMQQAGIDWQPLPYTKQPPVLSTLFDIWKMRRKAHQLVKQHHITVVHCRSYLSALIGLHLKRRLGLKFIFDMRGFWADERVEGGLWKLSNPIYKTIYQFFKKQEAAFVRESDEAVSLTYAGRDIINNWWPNAAKHFEVIPCCADMDLFHTDNLNTERLNQLRAAINPSGGLLLSYLGSLGTWYMVKEMMDFFAVLHRRRPDARLLFITQDKPEEIYAHAAISGIPPDAVVVRAAARTEVPYYLALSQYSIFFIRPTFSKNGSSPTKQGELMGMGIPLICNTGIGDTDRIVEQYQSGLLVRGFNESEYEKTVTELLSRQFKPQAIRSGAIDYFSLDKGVERYWGIYQKFK